MSNTHYSAAIDGKYIALQLISVQVHHKAYTNAQQDELCKRWAFTAEDSQQYLWYQKIGERHLL